jgi:hypothetical protein
MKSNRWSEFKFAFDLLYTGIIITQNKLTWFDALDLPHGLDGSDLDDIVQVLDAEEVHQLLHLLPQVSLGQGGEGAGGSFHQQKVTFKEPVE